MRERENNNERERYIFRAYPVHEFPDDAVPGAVVALAVAAHHPGDHPDTVGEAALLGDGVQQVYTETAIVLRPVRVRVLHNIGLLLNE